MPQNKRESLIYTIAMCFLMVLWMSMYNVALQMGGLSLNALQEGWMGFPFAYIFAMCVDWFFVSKLAKGFAFHYLITPQSSTKKKALTISCCMVIPMVLIMSLYGALEACLSTSSWNHLLQIWITNIPTNVMMALPFQLIIAGPMIRKIFRSAFPEGKVLA